MEEDENLGRMATLSTRIRDASAGESAKVQGRAIMFDYAGRQHDRRRPVVDDDLDTMAAALEELGFMPPPRYGSSGISVCGSAHRVSVRDVLDENEAGQAFLRWLRKLVGEGIPVNLSPEDFPGELSAIESWQRFCEVIRDALSLCEPSGRHLGLCIHSHQMPLEAYRLIADAVLGRGPRYVFLDSLQMAEHANSTVEERATANWSYLWRQRNADRPVMPVYGGIVRSACPLLADEVAATVLPGAGLHAPAHSAWIPIMLPIMTFATPGGQIRWQPLIGALGKALLIVEKMFDQVCWHDHRQHADARENRRLGFCITGIGDLVLARGDDPTSLDCLRWLGGVITRIRVELQQQSRRIALRKGAIPALEEANHVAQWRAGPHRESWRQHWDDAVRNSAMRHRNLLVMSPYAIIPTAASSTAEFSDLLPVIALADAWAFGAPPDFGGWNAAEYRHFHRRARATIQGSHSASFIAAGV